jgi:hypothetical protein
MIVGEPNNFAIHIGIGRLIRNLAIAGAETVLLSGLFLAVDIPEMLWTRHVENEILKRIVEMVEG